MRQVGVVGLGVMGRAMARNLVAGNYPVVGFDISAEVRTSLGGSLPIAESLDQLAQDSDIVLLSLPGPLECEATTKSLAVLCGGGTLVVDTSTVDPQTSTRQCALLDPRVGFVAAPVIGGQVGAENGSLTIIAGGKEDLVHRAMPVLELLGDDIQVTSSPATAAGLKLINNLMSLGNTVVFAEAFALAVRAGIPPDLMYEVLKGGSGGSAALRRRYEMNISRDDYRPGFSVALAVKDLQLVEQFSAAAGITLAIVTRTRMLYADLIERGMGDEDVAVLVREFMKGAGNADDGSAAIRPDTGAPQENGGKAA